MLNYIYLIAKLCIMLNVLILDNNIFSKYIVTDQNILNNLNNYYNFHITLLKSHFKNDNSKNNFKLLL